ncbi:MAG: hypothetical protein LQ341_007656, partial [Variospora aurantia]
LDLVHQGHARSISLVGEFAHAFKLTVEFVEDGTTEDIAKYRRGVQHVPENLFPLMGWSGACWVCTGGYFNITNPENIDFWAAGADDHCRDEPSTEQRI